MDTRDGLFYATKTLNPPFKDLDSDQKKWDEEEWRDNMRNEIDMMRNNPCVSVLLLLRGSALIMTLIIEQPNVMRVVDFQLIPKPTRVMPYYSDGHLARHLRRLSEKQQVSVLRRILLGLRHLYGRGITHRDLKPENLLVDVDVDKDEIAVVITDFGFSKIATLRNDLLKTFCGALLYAAPHVVPDRSDGYGANVDIWLAGVIIFGMYGLPDSPPLPWRKSPREQADVQWRTISRLGPRSSSTDSMMPTKTMTRW